MKLKPRKVAVTSALSLAGALSLLAVPAASSSIEACGESGACTQLRQQTFANLQTWAACDPSLPNPNSQCIFVAGNPKDCTGILTCEFAVNLKFREVAELTVATMGEQSQGCYLCAVPSCITASDPYCEPVSRECIVVSGFTSSGSPIGTTEDSGASSPIDDSGPAIPLEQ
jgi:hypothetical protein